MALEKINADDTLNQGRIKINNIVDDLENKETANNSEIELANVLNFVEIHDKTFEGSEVVNTNGFPIFSDGKGDIGSIYTGSENQSYWYQKIINVKGGYIFNVRFETAPKKVSYIYFLDESNKVVDYKYTIKDAVSSNYYTVVVPMVAKKMLVISFNSGCVIKKAVNDIDVINYNKGCLIGKFERGTSYKGTFTELNRRVTTKELLRYDEDVLLRVKKDGYLFFVQTFKENGELISDSNIQLEYKIPSNTFFRIVIQTTTDFEQLADVYQFYNSIECFIKKNNYNSYDFNAYALNYKSRKALYFVNNKDIFDRKEVVPLLDFGTEGFQSFAIDKNNDILYKFGWFDNASKAIKYKFSTGEELERITKPDTAHDNDAVYINGNVYIAGADKRTSELAKSCFRWNIQSNAVNKLNTSFIKDNPNGSTRIVVAVAQVENKNALYIICLDHDYTQPYDELNKKDDKMSVYFYDLSNDSGYLVMEEEWVDLYIQGACAKKDLLFIAANMQKAGNTNYRGILIKVYDLVSHSLVRQFEFFGDFEPEGLNIVDDKLYIGYAKHNTLAKISEINNIFN